MKKSTKRLIRKTLTPPPMSMEEVKETLLEAVDKYPDLEVLRELIAAAPSDQELSDMEREMFGEIEELVDFDLDTAASRANHPKGTRYSRPEPPVPMAGSTPISIRLPRHLLNSLKRIAAKKKMRYQTFIVKVLKAAAHDPPGGPAL